jgi:hypothetical protein
MKDKLTDIVFSGPFGMMLIIGCWYWVGWSVRNPQLNWVDTSNILTALTIMVGWVIGFLMERS